MGRFCKLFLSAPVSIMSVICRDQSYWCVVCPKKLKTLPKQANARDRFLLPTKSLSIRDSYARTIHYFYYSLLNFRCRCQSIPTKQYHPDRRLISGLSWPIHQ